jgi:hypothetical protein
MIKFEVEELGSLTFSRPRWADFAAWLDSFLAGQTGDAQNNLCVGCAVTPTAGELAEIFADGFGFLPGELVGHLLADAGLPEGLSGFAASTPYVTLRDAEDGRARASELGAAASEEGLIPRDLIDAARKRTRRPIFARTPLGVWACKAPGTAEASAYEDAVTAAMQGRGSRAAAMRALVLSCVISPEPTAAQAALEECPALALMLARSLRAVAGEGKALARVSG